MPKKIFTLSFYLCISTGIPIPAAESMNIGSLQVFPPDNPWNWDISSHAVHPNSDNLINSIGRNDPLHPDFGTVWAGAPNGIPYIVVDNSQAAVPIVYTAYGDESDPGPFPIPLNAPIEGGPSSTGDRHVISVDTANKMLYEIYRGFPQSDHWEAASGAAFDLSINDHHPETWTSADAAGLPLFPGLVRYEEVHIKKEINHALRFTVERSQRKYIFPARHFASSSTDPNLPPMGLRFRLKADFDTAGFSEPIRVILTALKKHGMMVADNGGDWFISGAPDDRWDDDVLRELKSLTGDDFEAVQTVDANGDPIYPAISKLPDIHNARKYITVRTSPNPFYLRAEIFFSIPPAEKENPYSLKIFDTAGRLVCVLLEGRAASQGISKRIIWKATDGSGQPVCPGIYFFRLKSGRQSVRGALVKLK